MLRGTHGTAAQQQNPDSNVSCDLTHRQRHARMQSVLLGHRFSSMRMCVWDIRRPFTNLNTGANYEYCENSDARAPATILESRRTCYIPLHDARASSKGIEET
jgi:hypothetical protein